MPTRYCKTKYCRNKARPKRKMCNTCDKKQWRAKYPMKACFQTLRQNARRRGKIFKLTFVQFEKFCYRTNYLAGKGRKKDSFSIDRIDNSKGYTVDNIQMIPKGINSSKRNKLLVYDWQSRTATVI